ncbi:MAG TPA: OmpH family outer membrane protein [Candidatus Elarobacter sp.]|jgi:outer membrane protein
MTTQPTRGRGAALAFALAAAFLASPAIGATDVTDIGAIDQSAIAALPAFASANKQLYDYGQSLQKQFASRAAHASQSQQQQLAGEYQKKMADKQRQVLGPLLQRAQTAIASVASSKNLTIVVDRRIVVFGGQDITGNVRDLLTGVGEPVPPVSTPPPSKVGYVDQQAIDQTPKVKAATDDFLKFKADQDKAAADKLKAAKTNADRDAVLKDYRKTLDDKQNASLKPMIDTTRSAIADVAKAKGLVLVVDRGNVVFGGTDITSDVTAKLK